MEDIHYALIMLSSFAASASPGPATLAIAGAAMNRGRYCALALATGVLTGSLMWSTLAAFGLAAILHTNVWLFEILRVCGGLYLLLLAFKSLRSAMNSKHMQLPKTKTSTLKANYVKGLLLHLTNPKAILFFGALYSIGVPSTAKPLELLSVIVAVGAVSTSVFIGYALLFSNQAIRQVYLKSKLVFESVFAAFFAAASIKLLMSSIK